MMPGKQPGLLDRKKQLLRSPHPQGRDHFLGCLADGFVMGIESDGG